VKSEGNLLVLNESRQSVLQPNGIQVILFDLDGTLRHNKPASVQIFLDAAVRLGAQDSPELRRKAVRWTHYYWAQSPELLEDVATLRGQEDAFWTQYAERQLLAFGCTSEFASGCAPELHRYMSEEHKPQDWVPEEVTETLFRLKNAGFRLGVVTNRREPCGEYLDSVGLSQYLDLALAAGEISYWKPQPEIFRHALDRLRASPAEAVYVGDNYYADVLGAQRAGLRPVLIDPEGIFPEAECDTIRSMSELIALLSS
jgi:HAD superfamily hydrolase (TIGR01549 family)